MVEVRLSSLQDTRQLASFIARFPLAGKVMGLSGPLGSGKTTFTRELVAALGSKDQVSSPTFVLCHEYQGQGIWIEHWDLYRLDRLPFELLEETNSLRIVEWAEKAPEFFEQLDLSLQFDFLSTQRDAGSEQRIVKIKGELQEKLKKEFAAWL